MNYSKSKRAITPPKMVQSNAMMICDYPYCNKQVIKDLRNSLLKCRRSCA